MRRTQALVVLTFFLAPVFAGEQPYIYQTEDGVAIRGYDAVAYMTLGKAVKGDEDFSYEWKNATWYFSSAAHLEAFKREPEKFAPQFGGYCAYAVGNNYLYRSDPKYWRIVNGKLYLNANRQAQELWSQDIPGYIEKGNTNWPAVLGK